jgi:hypothetical protein
MHSRDFVSGYVAPQYLIEGILQQRRIYSLTGKTGDGKTALQLFIAFLLATATPLGKREVERCRVLYLAGENPDDVRARWIAMSDALGFDADTIDVHFVEGVFSVSGMFDRVKAEAEAIGGFGAVIVDTSAAYFEGDAENDNVQLGNWARMLRKLSGLPGHPGCLSVVTQSRAAKAYCHAAAVRSWPGSPMTPRSTIWRSSSATITTKHSSSSIRRRDCPKQRLQRRWAG